ncbi:MAG: T9SS type A sorting domain-containing protein [Paludibacter sp.]|nr:T9SS type A sorting domain-containing protein [Paludibacter sp.]
MKKIIGILLGITLSFSVTAIDFTGIKIYLNPGHGGYDGANDRNLITINYPLGDTLGFWESWSNLQKGLALRDMLQNSGATVIMSRTQNREIDDRSLTEIAEEANANNVDAFMSIHSNAIGNNVGTNYILILYHGSDNVPTVAASLPMAASAWPRLMSNQLSNWTYYTASSNLRGDYSFYGNTSGLGVLRSLTVPGFLSEGSFHDYQPETHRLLNVNYRKLEAVNFYRYFCDYFQRDLPATGVIGGFVKGKDETIVNPKYIYKAGTNDRWLPLNGAKVKLMNAAGDSLNICQIDTLYNGIFAFYNLTPGIYKLRITANNHTSKDTTVTVAAAVTSYAKMMLVNPNIVIPKDTTPNYPDPVQEAGVVALNKYNFGTTTPVIPEWLNPNQIRKVLFRNEKLYILTTEPKIIIANAITTAKIREMDLTGIAGGVNTLSDINFTSDGYLLSCNKDTVGLPETKERFFKVYTWDNDSIAPKLLFKTQSQGNWSNGVIGETFAVSGPRWKCTVYTPSVTTGSSKAIRIIGLLYEEGISAVGYKYMIDATNYTESLWGKKVTFTISPTGNDHFYLDSEKVLPTEYQFDWNLADRSLLVNKGIFAEKSGYTVQPVASGSNFFRNAKHVFMASPVCQADSTAVGVVMFDITNGLSNAVKISEKLPEAGLGTTKTTYMAAAAKVSGYDIDLMILAQNQGMARYKTVVPLPKANIYASELKAENTTDGYNLKFTLNENATSVVINIHNGTDVVKTIDAGAKTKGQQSVSVLSNELPEGSFTWKVNAVAESVDRPLKISDNNQPQMQFYSPRGVAVDNNFESNFFGRVYASETVPGTVTNRTTKDGIYILNSALQDVTNQGANSYAGNITWGGSSSPMRLNVAPNGKVYLNDFSDANSGVWIMDPANPQADFKPVFSGLTRATNGLSSLNGVNVHGSISHCYVTGTGVDTKLYTFDQDYIDATATNTGNLLQYNIGLLAVPWQSAPSAVVYNDGLNGNLQQNFNSCIAPDGLGGWWISQYRATDAATIPSLIHVGMDGLVNFNSGTTPSLIVNSYTGGMAVNFDGTKLAMGCQDEVKVFAISYLEAGIPTLTRLHSIKPAMGANTAGISFDRAGNVYVISNSSERLGVWALPKTDNQFMTPAPLNQAITIARTGLHPIENSSESVRVYPNPVSEYLTVESASSAMQRVELFDLKGRLIISERTVDNKLNLSVSALQSGTYILKVKTNTGVSVKRIIKK